MNKKMKTLFEAWKNGDQSVYEQLHTEIYASVLEIVKANMEEGKKSKIESSAKRITEKVYQSMDSLSDFSEYDAWLKKIVLDEIGGKEKMEKTVNENVGEKKETENMNVKKTSNKKLWGIVFGVIVLLIVIGCAMNATPTIDMNKYTTVTYTGYDGHGTASVDVDWVKIKQDFGNKITYTKKTNDQVNSIFGEEFGQAAINGGFFDATDALEMYVDCTADTDGKDGELKNGDQVMVKWKVNNSYADALKVKIKADNKGYKVSGLDKVATKDVFENLDVSFSGIAPDGEVDYNYNGNDLNSYNFSVDKSYGLSDGDKVKIQITINNLSEFANKYGYIPEKMEQEYTVSNLPEYVRSVADVSESAKEYMKQEADDVITEWTADTKDKYTRYTVTGSEYVGDFLMAKKTSSSSAWYNNKYFMIYKLTYGVNPDYTGWTKVNEEDTGTYYCAIGYADVAISDNGEYDVDTSRNVGNSFYTYSGTDGLGYRSLEDLKSDIIDADATSYVYDGWNY